ncbi:MAG: bifunctional phosphopantothenoylcysteine decarboxylase/phosphopantothenate--cysteine ligase CoaBC [Gammaproteobacteria bacterium]|jgi:phosphopantothenoylcysteine decarboxylase/phosphopantothenate--cysteine ligase|nr:bifunctional phosphopantothenoylcysteine decarboxylase/phosphopantothenate--cysteine ligase CoaBC [Gammaproteobacteria bacterium]MBT3723558.1 bifunctional phosphopantothenoylcysteine decarboxylase/phosphopantothenate--cysteine ligase CoaBC [Gammaproteobacteria bacterium]MBT4192866.1 bifunctional phosphopantothenoylcysteine decarboxylase/phosphopantothenate--cysteine ligase CoaBC [Gammaproteobacteria bacterium]MBT4452273.1 bifunctional phosphopantothenoylcysteine decarboxylase/phosphopantothen
MLSLNNKNILLGVTGGIAAYKAAEFCRLLKKQGADVRVVMTDAAKEFIQPLTFQALTGNPVYNELFEADAQNAMDHIELARWADLLVIAPATADTLAKLADGYADNLLLTISLATKSKIAVAPAMNQQMFQNPATLKNIQTLQQRGVQIWGPDVGDQACGETGPGRMLEAEDLLQHVVQVMKPGSLSGCKVMITAGPTREAIDPVRYISNRSSGKMGYAVVQAAINAGADVTLVSGPVCLQSPQPVTLLACQSADEMYQQVMENINEQDIFIATAAVADYRMESIAAEKIKKSDDEMNLKLVKTEDILASVAALVNKPFCVGFAAETSHLEQYAQGKLKNKKLDLIAANRVDDPESGFEVENNALNVYWNNGSKQLSLKPKSLIAVELIDIITELFKSSRN